MIRRTTIEIDTALLDRAKVALGESTMRGAIEAALRHAIGDKEAERAWRAARQREYLDELGSRADLDVLRSDEMWR
jgi:Arc/MetJ family transcription regulator